MGKVTYAPGIEYVQGALANPKRKTDTSVVITSSVPTEPPQPPTPIAPASISARRMLTSAPRRSLPTR